MVAASPPAARCRAAVCKGGTGRTSIIQETRAIRWSLATQAQDPKTLDTFILGEGSPGWRSDLKRPIFHSQTNERKNHMAVKRHLRGVGSKEQRQYEHIKKSAQRSGRYGKRAKEVAARTVMKKHKRKGHKKGR